MPAFIHELDNATGKRKRDSSGLDERDVHREQEIQMKIAAASQYNGTQIPNMFANNGPFTARPILSPRNRTPGSNLKRRFLLSPKETFTFPGSPAYTGGPKHNSNPFSNLHASLDPFANASPLYNTFTQPPPSFDLPYTVNSLAENIRMINQEISQRPTLLIPQPQAQQKSHTTINLNPCHICMRRPTQRKDLDSYTDCEGCGKRCCWICVRQCLGTTQFWGNAMATPQTTTTNVGTPAPEQEQEDHEMGEAEENRDTEEHTKQEDVKREKIKWPAQGGHKVMICSACCVERGRDGEVRCLGCLKAEEAG